MFLRVICNPSRFFGEFIYRSLSLMKKFLRPLALLCLPVLPTSLTHAAFSPAIVAADSRWVIHVDLNLLRETEPGKKLLAAITTSQPGLLHGTVKLDLQKVLATVGTLTAYGSNFSQDPKDIDGTLIVQGTPDLRKIAEGLVAEATVSHPEQIAEIKDLPFEAYSVGGNKNENDGLIVGFPKEPIILVGKSKPHLLRAYEVFKGKAPSLARSSSGLSALMPKDSGAYLIAASVIPSDDMFPKNAPQARVLQMANSGSLALGEDKKLTYAKLQLVASSSEMADKLTKIIQGMTAMLSLAESSDKQLEEFSKSVTVQRHDNTVQLSMAYSSDRLVQMIEGMHEGSMHSPAALPVAEKPVATWTADQKLGSGVRGAEQLVTRTIENVQLSNGTTLFLAAHRSGNDPARIDFVEIVGQQPGATPLHFEAESALKLNGYRVESAPYASGGKVIALNGQTGLIRLPFPGTDGLYTVKVCYLDDPDGSATFTLTTRDPEPVSQD